MATRVASLLRRAFARPAGAFLAVGTMLLAGCSDAPDESPPTAASIAPLPEHAAPAQQTDPEAVTELERCVAAGGCQLVRSEQFSNATIQLFQESGADPALHVLTVYADGQPSLWSLEDEHAARYSALTCGLANCLLDVIVGPELLATIDMRMVSHTLTGYLEGAAVGSGLAKKAADLNGDGVLDLAVQQHLVRSDGTELVYYRTYVNDERQLLPTGCTDPGSAAAAPTSPQTRTCPS